MWECAQAVVGDSRAVAALQDPPLRRKLYGGIKPPAGRDPLAFPHTFQRHTCPFGQLARHGLAALGEGINPSAGTDQHARVSHR